jgi:hypothetical protein
MSSQPQKLSTADMVSAGQPPNVRRMERPAPGGAAASHDASDGRPGPLLANDEATTLRHQWETIQIGFVDEPRRSVEDADSLVAQAMKRVAEVFAEERAQLERQWSQGQDVSTEDLRVSLKRYRSFFDRLLSV